MKATFKPHNQEVKHTRLTAVILLLTSKVNTVLNKRFYVNRIYQMFLILKNHTKLKTHTWRVGDKSLNCGRFSSVLPQIAKHLLRSPFWCSCLTLIFQKVVLEFDKVVNKLYSNDFKFNNYTTNRTFNYRMPYACNQSTKQLRRSWAKIKFAGYNCRIWNVLLPVLEEDW